MTNSPEQPQPRPAERTPGRAPRIAVVTMGVKLGDETRGYTRFRALSSLLAQEGFEVDLITSSFQHWDKTHRDTSRECYRGLPYRIVFIDEPGYTRNLDLARIRSHAQAAKNLRAHFERCFASADSAYDLIYFEIPPNDVARACAEAAHAAGVPCIADINDLWPEAMRMVVNVPIVSDIAFYPFARDAKRVYGLIDAAVGTSDEYATRPAADRNRPYERLTVYVGNNLSDFDRGARERAGDVTKPAGEVWATYAGTLGASYDLATLVRAAALYDKKRRGQGEPDEPAANEGRERAQAPAMPALRVKVLGDGPDRVKLQELAVALDAPVDFVGYAPYDLMAAYLCASDIVVNSLVKSAPQSIVTKIGDYFASRNPTLNTGSSPEFRALIENEDVGANVEAEDPAALARALAELACDPAARERQGRRARAVAEERFDQERSYRAIVNLIRSLLDRPARTLY